MAKEKSEVVAEVAESDAKIAFRNVIEAYKLSNPEKYETKKEALEKKLNSL